MGVFCSACRRDNTKVDALPKQEAARRPQAQQSDGGNQQGDVPLDQQIDQAPTQGGEQAQARIRDYFAWRPCPWWLCFVAGIFFLTKLQIVYNDSPCAVLGTPGPVSLSDVKKAFRSLSMCTHPDRLRGRLKREPTQAESRRGEILFNRASAAKDEISKVLRQRKDAKTVPCYDGELEMAVFNFGKKAGQILSNLGLNDYWQLFMDLFWGLVTFDSGFFNTVVTILWLAFLFRILKQFFVYLWRMGIIRGTVALVTTVVIGPLPTVINFFLLPVARCVAYLRKLADDTSEGATDSMNPAVAGDADGNGNATAEDVPAASAKETPVNSTANVKLVAAKEKMPAGLRQRKKKETDEEKTKKNQDLLTGDAGAAKPVEGGQATAGPMPDGMWKCVAWSHREPVKARQAAAVAVQFDMLLILTKPIIPLGMLIALGQVWNGLFSSLFIGHALRKWVPQMSYEAHHILVSVFGMLHTLLGVTASQVEDYANREGSKVLQLAWSWSFKDVLSVMHMTLLGATVTAMSSLGNEPSYAASFAAGISVRIWLAQDSVRNVNVMTQFYNWAELKLRELGVALVNPEEVVANAGNGIGDCGGGPFRMLFGDGLQATWAARILKIWLMLIPLLSTMQWAQRTFIARRMLGKKSKTTRFVQRLILFGLGLAQCILLANLDMNASNAALCNFWVAMLFGCAGESLLSTYDVRGPVRQILFLVLFLLI